MAFVLVDLLTPCCFDGLDVYQVAGFTDKVTLVRSTVLDDDNPFEVYPEVLDPFLHCFFNSWIEPLQADFITATVLVGALELFMRRFDPSLSHIKAVHEFSGQKLDIVGDGYTIDIPGRECRPVDIAFHDQDELGFYPPATTGVSYGGLEKVKKWYDVLA